MNLAEKLKQFSATHHDELVNQNSKVLFVDGLNSYLRCFAATPTMNDDGDHVGGTTGFLRSIGLAIRQFKPSRVVIAFDGRGGSQRRRELFSEYKQHRKTMTKLNRTYDFQTLDDEVDSQKKQLHMLIAILQMIPVTVLAPDNVEADDVIAYYVKLVSEAGGKSIIMSTDKDFLQLVTTNVSVWNPVKKLLYNEQMVVDEYGIHPHNFIIYRSIDGDKSDGIPGIKGIGPATLIKNFPELANSDPVPWEHLFAAAEDNESKAAALILSNKDLLERNVSLMRLDEQHISGDTKLKILDQFNAPIPKLDKLGLTQFFVHSKLVGAFPNFDDWLSNTFTSLTRFSQKD